MSINEAYPLVSTDEICAQEPITTPGSIQPHGVLLATTLKAPFNIIISSANATEMLGLNPLGRDLLSLFGEDISAELQQRLLADELDVSSPWEVTLSTPSARNMLEAAFHVHGGLVVAELAPVTEPGSGKCLRVARLLQRWIGRLRASRHGIEALSEVVAQGVRQITGYERVLVYRFDPDWNGQAISENKADDWQQSLQGLHFPASDIPRQARELYHRSLIRYVPDRDYVPVPLTTSLDRLEERSIDLSFARLRSLSPIHLQYHRNMEVNGSMSLSVLRDDRLWGLVVCHHRQPHLVSPIELAAAAALVDAFALRVGPTERFQTEQYRREDGKRLGELLAHMADADDVASAVTTGPTTIGALFSASGAAAVHAGSVVQVGRTPPTADLLILAAWLRERPEQELFYTDRLPELLPAFAAQVALASGLLAVFLSSDRADMLLWFRPEEPQTVSWGGDPRHNPNATTSRPMPRQSFERWIEVRHGRSRAWAEWELEMAATLRHAITEVVVRSLRRVSELNEKLRQSQKMEAVGQLTGGIAHDFNNLLAGISGSLEMLETRLAQGRLETLDRYVSAAQGSARRAAALTQRLLAFSRRQTLDPKPTDVNKLVAGMEDLLRRSLGPFIALEVIGAGGLWATRIDPGQLENALLNLCINARDAMPDGGRVTIETANKWLDDRAARERDLPRGQFVTLCVTDTGSGMTAEIASRVFDPFFTTKPLGQGTGLGLSMVHGFVRQSGGQVRVYSEVGIGTTMCLYLPRFFGSMEEADFDEALASDRTGRGEMVLVVDDEPTMRMLMVEVIEDAGYAAIEAADGAAALRILQSDIPLALLITDVGLPGGINGRQVADAARVARLDLKVLFVTGYAENAVVGNGHLDPGMEVITKPFAMTTLANKLREMIIKAMP